MNTTHTLCVCVWRWPNKTQTAYSLTHANRTGRCFERCPVKLAGPYPLSGDKNEVMSKRLPLKEKAL